MKSTQTLKSTQILIPLLLLISSTLFAAPQWSDMTMSDLRNFVQHSSDLGDLAQRQFYFEVNENHWQGTQEYLNLQTEISKKIPHEFDRPVIDLRLSWGDHDTYPTNKTIGILGGMGPLSDAHLLKLVLQKLQTPIANQARRIHLFSLPPPRTTWEQIRGGALYGARLARFINRRYDTFYLASNTAHLNYGLIKGLSGGSNIAHLPKQVVDDFKSESADKTVLILGTSQAWQKNLYSDLLDESKVSYRKLSYEDQEILQDWIQRIKENRWDDNSPQQLRSFIETLAETYNAEALLLSCTELPLGLASEIPKMKDDGYMVIDTESLFAEFIAERFSSLP